MKLRPLISKEEVEKKVKELADRISQDYQGKEIILIGVLKGAFVFLADLMRKLKVPVKVDFIWTSSYGASTESSGEVRFISGPTLDVKGKDVLVVEDIIDTGLSLKSVVERLKDMGASSVRTCVLLDKKERRKVEFDADYVGFNIPDKFVVGYGLDFSEKYRELEGVWCLEEL